jgi:CRP-like cAMP-binding protein/Fe-S-cluster-containing hydrogenase component 2
MAEPHEKKKRSEPLVHPDHWIFALAPFASMENPKARKALVENHMPLNLPRGKVFVRQGEFTTSFCVIARGLVAAYSESGDGTPRKIADLAPNEWFGEMCALSNQPALATVRAEVDCTVIALDPPTFKVLYQYDTPFKEMIDRRYRERALASHLRAVPLFKHLDDATLERIRAGVELVVLEPKPARPALVAKAGEEADAVWLVRSGAVKCTRRGERGEEQVLAYYMDNSSFGARALASSDRRWPGNYEAMVRTDLVRVPRELFEMLSDPGVLDELRTTANRLVETESGRTAGSRRAAAGMEPDPVVDGGTLENDRFEVIVGKQSFKGGEALVIDLSKCTRCNACVESCVAVHDDRVPRLSKVGTRISLDESLSSACYNCAIPECMLSCNYGAIRRDVAGAIDFVWDNCVGCTACVEKCPYNVIRMTPPPGFAPLVEPEPLLASLPWIGSWFARRLAPEPKEAPDPEPLQVYNRASGKVEEVLGKAIKCDLCSGLPFEACVYNCPCGAIGRRSPEELFELET